MYSAENLKQPIKTVSDRYINTINSLRVYAHVMFFFSRHYHFAAGPVQMA